MWCIEAEMVKVEGSRRWQCRMPNAGVVKSKDLDWNGDTRARRKMRSRLNRPESGRRAEIRR